MPYHHDIFLDHVRDSLFFDTLSQGQVDGMEAILDGWETHLFTEDPRFLAYMFATTYHETAQSMLPVEEYKGSSQPYGAIDPETNQGYWGRGFVQLTHRENYARADKEAGWTDDDSCEWHAINALDAHKAGRIMWFGMSEGWFRTDNQGPQTLIRYFSSTADDAYGAREIINGDQTVVPSWADGMSIGNLIAGYHTDFLAALNAAYYASYVPAQHVVAIAITTPTGVQVAVTVNGKGISDLGCEAAA